MKIKCVFTQNSPSTSHISISMETCIVLHSFLLADIIKAVKDMYDTAAREVLRQIFHSLDELWLRCKDKDSESCKFIGRSVNTIFGRVTFHYRQGKRDGKFFRPLLEMLGIARYQRLTDDLLELVRRSALYTSYRKALKIGGSVCALSTLWTAVQKEGISYREKRDRAVYYYLEGEPSVFVSSSDFAVVMIDEIWLRESTRKLPGTAHRKFIKVKVLRCSVARKRGDAYEWEPLRVFASARDDQSRFLKDARRFLNAAVELHCIPRIMVLTDGCAMGRNFCALYPGQAVWQLDWWHLFNHVHKGCKFEKNLENEVCGLISVEKTEEALALLRAYQIAMTCMETKLEETLTEVGKTMHSLVKPKVFWSTRQREALGKCITYLENNQDGIFGVKAFAKDIPAEFLAFGTGPLERLQAVMIAYRMKKQGKSWSVPGADNLIQLLSREWNGEGLELLIEEGLEGLSDWETACSPLMAEASESLQPVKGKKSRLDFSPLPGSCVPLLQRGKTDSFFTPLKKIGELKLIPHLVDFRGEGCLNV